MAENIKDKLNKLVFDFKLSNYRDLNESQTRISYIDRFWELLGWNVRNPLEVQVERTDKSYMGRRPDYRFIKGNKTLFFVEAKKPAEDLTNPRHIYQTKLYCWNGKVPIAILTDFEEFRPFRALGKPLIGDAKKGLIKELDMLCEEYPDRVDDLLATFGREAVFAGSLDELVKPTQLELRDTVDKHFLNSLSEWRIKLASLIAKKNHFDNEFELAEATQRILDRLVFLRILQDRDIENTDFIKSILEHRVGNSYAAFLMICKELAPKYNGLIFNPHPLSENLTIEASLFKNIVKELNVEDSPYRFDEIPVEVLGTIYERFLGDEISFDKGRQVVIDQKPEVRKAGGVYYTPQYIVEYIVANTVGKLLEQARTPDDVSRLKILDPACGSGSFLLGAFDALIKWHEDYYNAHITEIHEKKGRNTHLLAFMDEETGKLRLTARKKGRILQNNIYGVDIDKQATEVAQMSLYLKVLEGIAKEPLAVLGFQDALLPKMDDNIKCGNSLIGSDFISDDFFGMSERERHKINPFDWEVAFPFLKMTGGFDAVIGNPPYIRIQTIQEFNPKTVEALKNKYLSAQNGNYDIYVCFVEQGVKLLSEKGLLGFILPHKFFNANYGQGLRTILSKNNNISEIIHFGDIQIFDGATTYTCLLFLNRFNNDSFSFTKVENLDNWRYFKKSSSNAIDSSILKMNEWNFQLLNDRDLMLKLNSYETKLSDFTENISQGFKTGSDEIFIHNFEEEFLEEQYYVKVLKGKDIQRYSIDFLNRFAIFPYINGVPITETDLSKDSPKIYNYLLRNKDRLMQRDRGKLKGPAWFCFSRTQFIRLVDLKKIITRDLANTPSFTLDDGVGYGLMGGYGITLLPTVKESIYYILGLLNSSVSGYFISKSSSYYRGGFYSYEKRFIKDIPIKKINFENNHEKAQHDKIVELVERMLRLHKELQTATEFDRKHIEQYISRTDKEIDALVYQLYALTPEEIKIVEGGE
ncbi:MAG: Eco57I restriction-modification methylase domain-containing protein [Candidatus Kapabacteria bacterium]|nr:Eco57I restriction-modification methylase domain-containing protein [Candidatus Kapabacteria bacterium]